MCGVCRRRRSRAAVAPRRSGISPEFFEAAANPTWVIAAHNEAFETAIEQLAMSLAAGLPARRAPRADALELKNRKDAAGERLMHLTSKPRKPRKGEDPGAVILF